LGAHVRRTLGMSRNPLSSTKTRWAPRRAAFFYPWPLLALPPGDGGLVPLDGAALRLLTAPPERRQHLPDMRRVIAHPELLANHFSHPRQRPELRPVASTERALAKQRHESAFLRLGQPRRSSRRRLGLQRAGTLPLVGVPPAKHRTHGRPDLTGDGREGPARLRYQPLTRAPCSDRSAGHGTDSAEAMSLCAAVNCGVS
jgi:hypothetical protein